MSREIDVLGRSISRSYRGEVKPVTLRHEITINAMNFTSFIDRRADSPSGLPPAGAL